MINIIEWIKSKIGIRKNVQEQKLFIYCKGCKNEMVSDGSFVSDTYEDGENHVRYNCKKCGKESDYNFDIAPIPINWEELRPNKIKR